MLSFLLKVYQSMSNKLWCYWILSPVYEESLNAFLPQTIADSSIIENWYWWNLLQDFGWSGAI